MPPSIPIGQRLSYMQEVCRKRGVSFGSLSFDEQNALWEEAKQKVESSGRGERVRTSDLSVPNAARYQTALRPAVPIRKYLPASFFEWHSL